MTKLSPFGNLMVENVYVGLYVVHNYSIIAFLLPSRKLSAKIKITLSQIPL